MTLSLPIDEQLPAIREAIDKEGCAIVVAEPGAGKTTRVPAAFLGSHSSILCTQPRRIAARLSAQRVASEEGFTLGQEVGFETRFERKSGPNTRLTFMTEGLALRKWQSMSTLKLLILDEFHERHLQGDTLLALAKEARKKKKLNLLIMSATLEADEISEYLGGVPILRSAGRSYPIAVHYQEARRDEELATQVSRAIKEALRQGEKRNFLVFLPGIAEIRRCTAKLEELSQRSSIELCALHGSLPAHEQNRALSEGAIQKIVLSTNIAETSLTLPNIGTVVDSGLARVAKYSPWTGLSRLDNQEISQASAAQRAGRAGRTQSGNCVRLYTEHAFHSRPAFDSPEIVRADLSASCLNLASLNQPFSQLSWLTDAPETAKNNSQSLLHRLGAFEAGRITDEGKRMAEFPIHPRLARLLLQAEALKIPKTGAYIAALLSEKSLTHSRRRGEDSHHHSTCDLLDDLELLLDLKGRKFAPSIARAAGIDLTVAKAADKLAIQILSKLTPSKEEAHLAAEQIEVALGQSLLAAFPDRVCRRKEKHSDSFLMCEGGAFQLSSSSAVQDSEYILATGVRDRKKGLALIDTACAIDPSWLLDLPLDELDDYRYDRNRKRVKRVTGLYYGKVAVDEEIVFDANRMSDEACSQVLMSALLEGELVKIIDQQSWQAWQKRYQFAQKQAPELEWPEHSDAYLAQALITASGQSSSLASLAKVSLKDALYWPLPPDLRKAIDKLAPENISLPGRKRVPVHYEIDRPPWIESRLQDFFGLREGPKVGKGVALTLHLQAPNRRAVQVTSDLESFWTLHYPGLRKQLMRRYPRHKWPETP